MTQVKINLKNTFNFCLILRKNWSISHEIIARIEFVTIKYDRIDDKIIFNDISK